MATRAANSASIPSSSSTTVLTTAAVGTGRPVGRATVGKGRLPTRLLSCATTVGKGRVVGRGRPVGRGRVGSGRPVGTGREVGSDNGSPVGRRDLTSPGSWPRMLDTGRSMGKAVGKAVGSDTGSERGVGRWMIVGSGRGRSNGLAVKEERKSQSGRWNSSSVWMCAESCLTFGFTGKHSCARDQAGQEKGSSSDLHCRKERFKRCLGMGAVV